MGLLSGSAEIFLHLLCSSRKKRKKIAKADLCSVYRRHSCTAVNIFRNIRKKTFNLDTFICDKLMQVTEFVPTFNFSIIFPTRLMHHKPSDAEVHHFNYNSFVTSVKAVTLP